MIFSEDCDITFEKAMFRKKDSTTYFDSKNNLAIRIVTSTSIQNLSMQIGQYVTLKQQDNHEMLLLMFIARMHNYQFYESKILSNGSMTKSKAILIHYFDGNN